MATNLYSGYEQTKRVRLPDGKTNIDVKTPLGASTMATLIRANSTGNFENVGNALALNEAVTASGANSDPVVVDTQEVTVLKDADGVEHEVTNPRTVEVYIGYGMKIVRTTMREITSQ
jgi:hypothetical protein